LRTRTWVVGLLLTVFLIAAFLTQSALTPTAPLHADNNGDKNSVLLTPIIVSAQTGGSSWSLNESDVVIVSKYLDATWTVNLTQLFNAIQGWVDLEEIMLLDTGLLFNKTLDLRRMQTYYSGIQKGIPCKFGFLVTQTGEYYVWAWRKYYNDTDFLGIVRVDAPNAGVDIGTVYLSTAYALSQLYTQMNSALGLTLPTDPAALQAAMTHYIPSRPTATRMELYHAGIYGTNTEQSYYVNLDPTLYSEAILTVASWTYNGGEGRTEVYINGTLVYKQTTSGWKTGGFLLSPGTPTTIGLKVYTTYPTSPESAINAILAVFAQ